MSAANTAHESRSFKLGARGTNISLQVPFQSGILKLCRRSDVCRSLEFSATPLTPKISPAVTSRSGKS